MLTVQYYQDNNRTSESTLYTEQLLTLVVSSINAFYSVVTQANLTIRYEPVKQPFSYKKNKPAVRDIQATRSDHLISWKLVA